MKALAAVPCLLFLPLMEKSLMLMQERIGLLMERMESKMREAMAEK